MVPLFLIGLVLASAAPPGPPVTLAPPICEPSALLARPGGTFLVGDNERDALYEIDDRGAMLATLPLPGAPADVEALAAWGDAVVVVGSHSRGNPRKGCEVKERRLALLVARVAGEALTGRLITVDGPLDGGMDKRARNGLGERRAASLAAVPACVQGWFQGRPAGAEAVCAALVAAEARAALDAGACAQTLNIEGAVVAQGRLWLGLRAPVVAGRAVFLRVLGASPDALDGLRFDAVAFADLGGLGVRDLAPAGADVLGIAGPQADAAGFQLFRLPAAALAPGATVVATRLGPAPEGAEGLAVAPGGLRYVVDGAKDAASDDRCEAPGRFGRLPLPEAK